MERFVRRMANGEVGIHHQKAPQVTHYRKPCNYGDFTQKRKALKNSALWEIWGLFGDETGDYGRYANVLRIPSSGLYLFLWVSVGGVLPNSLKKMRIHFENDLGFLLLSILP